MSIFWILVILGVALALGNFILELALMLIMGVIMCAGALASWVHTTITRLFKKTAPEDANK